MNIHQTQGFSEGDIAAFYRWFTAVRTASVAVVGLTVAALWWLNLLPFDPVPILFIVLPVMLGSSLLWLTVLEYGLWPKFFLYAQLGADLAIVTVGLYYAGSARGDFVFLYLLLVISAALISLRAVILTTAASALAYLGLIYGAQLGWLNGRQASLTAEPSDLIRLGVFVFVALVLGLQSYYYVSRFKRKDDEILRLKDEFLFRAVHDLRAPLTAIRWITEKFRKPGFLAQHPDLRDDVRQMQEMSSRMLSLIQDLLAVSRGEQTEVGLKSEVVNTTGLLRQVAQEVAAAAAERNVLVSFKPYAAVLNATADREALKEVLSNLAENAVKYNRPGGAVILTNRAVDGTVELVVEDTGIGISPESMPKLFTPYFRAAEVKKVPGTGLGLYLVKKLVEKMSGRVTVASTAGQGTSFTVSLPAGQG